MRRGERRYVEITPGEYWIAELLSGPSRRGFVKVRWKSGPLEGREGTTDKECLGEEVR